MAGAVSGYGEHVAYQSTKATQLAHVQIYSWVFILVVLARLLLWRSVTALTYLPTNLVQWIRLRKCGWMDIMQAHKMYTWLGKKEGEQICFLP